MAVNDADQKRNVALPDLDSAAADEWAKQEFPIRGSGSRNRVQVVLKRSVLNSIHEHGLSRTDVEVCGVMVGQCYQDERGPFVYIENIIQGNHSESQVAQVTFTAETWNHIQNEMDERFEDKRILGWYHTHPGFGIFLSEMDMFIHKNFFSGNEQLAFVYDPIGGQEGLFLWRDGQAIEDHCLVEEDAGNAAERPSQVPRSEATAAAAPNMEAIENRLRRIERRQGWMVAVLCLVVVLAVAWPFAIQYLAPPARNAFPPLLDSASPDRIIDPPAGPIVPETRQIPLYRNGQPDEIPHDSAVESNAMESDAVDSPPAAQDAQTFDEAPAETLREASPEIGRASEESLPPDSVDSPARDMAPEADSTEVPEENPELAPAAGETLEPEASSTAVEPEEPEQTMPAEPPVASP